MDGFYEVTYGEVPVGKAELRREGLYGSISCRCSIPDKELYRILAIWEDGWLNLGIPVPDVEGFALKKSVPMKYLGEQKLRFILMNASQNPDDAFKQNQMLTISDNKGLQKEETIGCETSEDRIFAEENDKVLISEDDPFDQLPEIMNARLEIGEEGYNAVFMSVESDIQSESDGTMVRTQDIGVDGSGENFITDPV